MCENKTTLQELKPAQTRFGALMKGKLSKLWILIYLENSYFPGALRNYLF